MNNVVLHGDLSLSTILLDAWNDEFRLNVDGREVENDLHQTAIGRQAVWRFFDT